MFIPNIWNNILSWFNDQQERCSITREFNYKAKDSFVAGVLPTLLRSSISRGFRGYRHQFSSLLFTGFRIQALTGQEMTKEDLEYLGLIMLKDTNLIRHLVALGFDTLEIYGDKSKYGLRWKLIDYTAINKLVQ